MNFFREKQFAYATTTFPSTGNIQETRRKLEEKATKAINGIKKEMTEISVVSPGDMNRTRRKLEQTATAAIHGIKKEITGNDDMQTAYLRETPIYMTLPLLSGFDDARDDTPIMRHSLAGTYAPPRDI